MTILLYIQASATISSSVRARQKRVTSRCARPVRDSLCPVCFRARTFIIANTSTRRCHNRQFCNQFFLVKSQSKFYHEHIVRAIVYIILCIHGTCHDVCCWHNSFQDSSNVISRKVRDEAGFRTGRESEHTQVNIVTSSTQVVIRTSSQWFSYYINYLVYSDFFRRLTVHQWYIHNMTFGSEWQKSQNDAGFQWRLSLTAWWMEGEEGLAYPRSAPCFDRAKS